MARQVQARLETEYPDYTDLVNLLSLARLTWPLYGLGAGDLAGLDEAGLAMLWLAIERTGRG